MDSPSGDLVKPPSFIGRSGKTGPQVEAAGLVLLHTTTAYPVLTGGGTENIEIALRKTAGPIRKSGSP